MTELKKQITVDEHIDKIVKMENSHLAEKRRIYEERSRLIALISKMFPNSSIEKDDNRDDEFSNVVYIELPTGQVSWHIRESEKDLFKHLERKGTKWDGHSTQEKYERIEACIMMQACNRCGVL